MWIETDGSPCWGPWGWGTCPRPACGRCRWHSGGFPRRSPCSGWSGWRTRWVWTAGCPGSRDEQSPLRGTGTHTWGTHGDAMTSHVHASTRCSYCLCQGNWIFAHNRQNERLWCVLLTPVWGTLIQPAWRSRSSGPVCSCYSSAQWPGRLLSESPAFDASPPRYNADDETK